MFKGHFRIRISSYCSFPRATGGTHLQESLYAMKPGATLGLSHSGFLLGYLDSVEVIPHDGCHCRRSPGPSGPSRLCEQGKDVNGAGINSSFAVRRMSVSRKLALGWGIALGSPVFCSKLRSNRNTARYL
jgi:ketol-acid reductoisomerase